MLTGCMLGILKAGGVYVPLDTQNPGHRIGRMVSGGRVSVIVTTREEVSVSEGELFGGTVAADRRGDVGLPFAGEAVRGRRRRTCRM